MYIQESVPRRWGNNSVSVGHCIIFSSIHIIVVEMRIQENQN